MHATGNTMLFGIEILNLMKEKDFDSELPGSPFTIMVSWHLAWHCLACFLAAVAYPHGCFGMLQ